MSVIVVRTLGAAEIVIGKKRITPKSEVMFALAVYLCVRAGERVPRQRVAEMFWPAAEPEKAKHSLRQMMYRLRHAGIHTSDKAELLSVEKDGVQCDLNAVMREGWAESATPSEVVAAAEFLPGFSPGISEEYDHWLDSTRSRVESQFRRAVGRHMEIARREGRWTDLEKWSELLLQSDPMSEDGTFSKARSIALTGSQALATEVLDKYVEQLSDSSGELAKRATHLRRRIAERPKDWGTRSGSEVPLVGHANVMRRLSTLVEEARDGRGGTLLLYGAPGIGKTRLCVETRDASSLTGVRTITVRADPSHAGRPLGLVGTLAPLLHDLSGVAGSAPAALTMVRRLCDSKDSDFTTSQTHFANITLEELSWAIAESLVAAAFESTVLVLLDDLHNADSSSLDVLHGALNYLRASRVAVLATARSHWLSNEDPAARKWLTVPRFHIPPLSGADSARLAASLSRTLPTPLTEEQCAQIDKRSGGNPLFLRELASQHSRPHRADARPLTLSSVIEQRCALLSARETRLLRVTALLGDLSTVRRLRLLLEARPSSLSEDIESLERDGLIRLEESGIVSLHECWRDALLADTSPATRSALALEIADALGASTDDAASIDVEWQRGQLYSSASCLREAMACFSRAGDQLLTIGVPTQAAAAYARGMSLASEAEDLAHFGALLGTAQHAAAQYALAADSCRKALTFVERAPTPHPALRASILSVLVDAEWKLSQSASASLTELAELVQDKSLPATVRNACCYSGMRVTSSHDGQLTRHFAGAVTLPDPWSHEDWQALATLLIFEAEVGSDERVRTLTDAISSPRLRSLPAHIRSPLLKHCSTARRYIGDLATAIELAEESATLAVSAGLLSEASSTALLIAFGYLDHQNPAEALSWIELAQKWNGPSIHDERARSLRHARGRYLLAAGRDEECYQGYHADLPGIVGDSSSRRRAVEAACIALAAARTGRTDDAIEALTIVEPVVRGQSPSFNLDFAADALVETLRILARPQEAADFGTDYLARRAEVFDRPLVPALKNLASMLL